MAEGARVGWVQRRLKVLTLRVMVTQDPLDLYKHSSMDAILSMLVHRWVTWRPQSVGHMEASVSGSHGHIA